MTAESKPQRPILKDGMGRTIVNLRISVTDRCNFRCTYCMPADNVEFMDREKLLTFEELTRVVGVVSKMGIFRLRLTGGEPLLRKDLPVLVQMLSAVEGIEDIAMTTNAFFLKQHAQALREAGLNRLNISLDALDQEKFAHVNRRDCLQQVLDGIAAARDAGYKSIKINAVAIRGFSEPEILQLVEYGRSEGFEIRFIEFMPLDADRIWERDKVLLATKSSSLSRNSFLWNPFRIPWKSVRPASLGSPTARARSASSPPSAIRSAIFATASA